MLIMVMLLNPFIEAQQAQLRTDRERLSENDADQIRTRIDIAMRLRGKLPLTIRHDDE